MSNKLWQALSDTDSQTIRGGVSLLLPACQAAREANRSTSGDDDDDVDIPDTILWDLAGGN